MFLMTMSILATVLTCCHIQRMLHLFRKQQYARDMLHFFTVWPMKQGFRSGLLPVWLMEEAHAWNMVKIGDLYYYVDATHASSSGNRDDYFLKGSISFADRQLDSDYLSADFTSEFPMSDFDYSDDRGNTEVGSVS